MSLIKKLDSIRRFLCQLVDSERGFFTIVGLCLLLAVAISIRGVQEFEGNYSTGATNFQIEHELQNIADSALVEAAEKIRTGNFTLNTSEYKVGKNYQRQISVALNINSKRLKNVSFEVWGEHTRLANFSRQYKSADKYTDTILKNETGKDLVEKCTVLISVASCDSPQIGGKIYRKAQAYILDSAPNTIHFLNDL